MMASTAEGDIETQLEVACKLDFKNRRTARRQTSIICTVGKASLSVEIIEQLILAGANIFRLNFSHDTHRLHEEIIANIHEARKRAMCRLNEYRYIGIAVDTKGPEIRTGMIDGHGELELKNNGIFRLSINKDVMTSGTEEVVYIDYPDIISAATPGTKIYLSDGAIVLLVTEVTEDCVICQVVQGGSLGSQKSVAIPGVRLSLPHISEKDRRDLKFAVKSNVDFIFASKVRDPSVIKRIRCVLGEKGKHIQIVTKIDGIEILPKLEDVIRESDGILIDRSNLGIAVPFAKFFYIQKEIIARCNREGKPVVLGTQLLESMCHNPHPTCAEVADVTNAVIEGADALMIASETAIGDFPVETIVMIQMLCTEAEAAVWNRKLNNDLIVKNRTTLDAVHAIALASVEAAEKTQAACIVVLTTSGRTANLISMYRPQCPILAVTRCPRTARQCLLRRNLVPILYRDKPVEDFLKDVELRIQFALSWGHRMRMVDRGDTVVVVSPCEKDSVICNNMRLLYAFF